MKYYFQIVVDGFSDDIESIERLRENLKGEIWHEESNVYPPTIHKLK
jgi:hypothetical protein